MRFKFNKAHLLKIQRLFNLGGGGDTSIIILFSITVLFIVCSILICLHVVIFILKKIIWHNSDSAHCSHLSSYYFLFNRWSLLYHVASPSVLSLLSLAAVQVMFLKIWVIWTPILKKENNNNNKKFLYSSLWNVGLRNWSPILENYFLMYQWSHTHTHTQQILFCILK